MKIDIHRRLHKSIERDQASSWTAAELAPVEKVDVTTGVVAVTVLDVSSPTDGGSQTSKLDTPDAEASG